MSNCLHERQDAYSCVFVCVCFTFSSMSVRVRVYVCGGVSVLHFVLFSTCNSECVCVRSDAWSRPCGKPARTPPVKP